MTIITTANFLVVLCAIFGYLNYRLFKLPNVIGIMIMALMFSTILMILPVSDSHFIIEIQQSLKQIDFSELLLHGMLGFLLFAGALHVDLKQLKKYRYIISFLAILGTLISCFALGLFAYYASSWIGFELPFLYALLLGALLSPTDPVAVMAILKKVGVPKAIESKVVGESLFNDGVAVVAFVAFLGILQQGDASGTYIGLLFVKEVVGGILLGLLLGSLTIRMLKPIDNYQLEVLLTLALVMGGYELAYLVHLSAPITIVIAGLIIGNKGQAFAMSSKTRQNLFNFWDLIDEFLNALLFLLIGLELMLMKFNLKAIYLGLLIIPAMLLFRFLSIILPISILRKWREFSNGVVQILTWGGLRGGISVALALSLPSGPIREYLLLVTYCVVLFSIIVQGLTIGKLAEKYVPKKS